MKLSANAFCCGLPGAMSCQPTLLCWHHVRIAVLVSSVPTRTTVCDDRGQLASNPCTGQRRRIGNHAEALAGEVVYHRQDAEPPAVGQRVGSEVQRPTLVRPAVAQRAAIGADDRTGPSLADPVRLARNGHRGSLRAAGITTFLT
jgi:hypothetical protein